jgi:hypothetical protein
LDKNIFRIGTCNGGSIIDIWTTDPNSELFDKLCDDIGNNIVRVEFVKIEDEMRVCRPLPYATIGHQTSRNRYDKLGRLLKNKGLLIETDEILIFDQDENEI